jgi:chorismate synthase
MNTFGRVFRVSVFGESHGPCIGVVIDGCPPGMSLDPAGFEPDLARRRPGGQGTTSRVEADVPKILSGVHAGVSTGAPISIAFDNTDVDSSSYARYGAVPRPGHADLPARFKYRGCADPRGGGHFSGRLTTGIVAAGTVAKKIIHPAIARARLCEACGSEDVAEAVRAAVEAGDSVGGVIECRVENVPAGLGEPFFDSVESVLAHAMFSIPGVKGIEFGAGFEGARMRGSAYNDAIIDASGATATNNAGGVNGGIANGNEIAFSVAVRPTASIRVPQRTVNLDSGQGEIVSVQGRHDACFALRVPVVVEAMTAIALADLLLVGR